MKPNSRQFYFLTTIVLLYLATLIVAQETVTFTVDSTKFDSWVQQTTKQYNEKKTILAGGFKKDHLDPELIAAEDGGIKVVRVKKDGSGDFKTVTEAVKSVPLKNTKRVVIWIGGGEYHEKVTVELTQDFVTFYGDPSNQPKIVFDGTGGKYGTNLCGTVIVLSNYFVAVNVAFVNSASPPPKGSMNWQAVALRISGDKGSFHKCRFISHQDTLFDNKGRHYFKDCLIQGTVDFIFGNGKSLYQNTTIVSVADKLGGVITAQGRKLEEDDSGFAFNQCNITGSTTGTTYLGRAWMERGKVVFANTYMGTIISKEGWSNKGFQERNKTVYYGEYNCKGPGATTAGRVTFAKQLTKEEAKPFMDITYIDGTSWILPPPKV